KCFFFNVTAPPETYTVGHTLSLHDALPISRSAQAGGGHFECREGQSRERSRSEEHTSELQSLPTISYAVFCLKKKKYITDICHWLFALPDETYDAEKHNP